MESRPGIPQSDEEFSERAHDVIPGGSHTYQGATISFPFRPGTRCQRQKAAGSGGWMARNVDWGMGINNVLIGHTKNAIDEAAIAAIRQGQAFSRPTMLEVAAAESVTSLFRGLEMVKFGKNGSDGNSAAIRLARAITGRQLIGYDGTAPFLSIHDRFIGKTTVNEGS